MSEFAVAEIVATLDELAIEINREIALTEESFEAGVLHAIKVGKKLTEARASVPRGDWMRWLNSQIVADYHAVSTFIALYEYREIIGDAPSVLVAQRLLRLKPEAPVMLPFQPDDAMRLSSSGWSDEKIARHLGVSVQRVKSAINPEKSKQKADKAKATKARIKRQIQAERTIAAERIGGGISATFKAIRRAQIDSNNLSETGATSEIRQAATLAYRAICRAEDEIAKILADA